MKVLLINGSPNVHGCTDKALQIVGKSLAENGAEYEIFHIGNKPVQGCIGCRSCKQTGICVFQDEVYTALREKIKDADGIIIGTPVYYSGVCGQLCTILDRIFYSCGEYLKGKPVSSVISCRVRGGSAAFERLSLYYACNQMIIVPSQYWNIVRATVPEDVEKDVDGCSVLKVLGRNMAWMLKSLEKAENPFPMEGEFRYQPAK